MYMTKCQKGVKKTGKKSEYRLQRPRLLQHAAIIKVVQIVIFWVLATQYTPYGRSITTVAQVQLSKGPKSGRCINTATHRACDKCHQLHTSSVRSLKMGLYKVMAIMTQPPRACNTQNWGRCNNRLMQRDIKFAPTDQGMGITSSIIHD